MIHLDTNYLIGLLVRGSREASEVDQWLAAGESLAASAITWSEFLNGPVSSSEASYVEMVLQSQIVSFGKAEAALAADLFNKTGRRRGTRFDCLIAGTAILNQSELATLNRSDFRAFTSYGLRLR
jgi:predicted nucleic acid-binding protein